MHSGYPASGLSLKKYIQHCMTAIHRGIRYIHVGDHDLKAKLQACALLNLLPVIYGEP